jgi:hypothetical protein
VTDPACSLSPHHAIVEAAREEADDVAARPVAFQYRQPQAPAAAG